METGRIEADGMSVAGDGTMMGRKMKMPSKRVRGSGVRLPFDTADKRLFLREHEDDLRFWLAW
jgi:hypothetical protein